MAKVQQAQTDLRRFLAEQVAFLRNSAASYDAGFAGEAKRLAVVARVLLHDTATSHSLLGLLGLKPGMTFIDTGDAYDPNQIVGSFHGLALVSLGSDGARFVPRCVVPPRPGLAHIWKPFDDWWKQVVIVDGKGESFARRDLVLNLANKEGGAHVDPALHTAWADLTRQNSMGFTFQVPGSSGPVDGIESTSCRQIADELIQSISKVRPELSGA